MVRKQLSVFLENKRGRFTGVARLLGKEGINMTAFTVSENSDFGILRLIVSDTDQAILVLRNNKYAVTEAEVIFLRCPNNPGSLGRVMEIITQAGIFIEYMYAFAEGDSANVVIRPDNLELCVEVLQTNQLELSAINELYKL